MGREGFLNTEHSGQLEQKTRRGQEPTEPRAVKAGAGYCWRVTWERSWRVCSGRF